ncbi:hypothetical protein [Actinotalea sp. C106]|uniref:hypothetical protein n=1 Tax=Actinotalea sp. C106 TaxID=2908644 RepID=UPI0020298DDC|nr:hypothetical protein [Actinotalea sp. C106]
MSIDLTVAAGSASTVIFVSSVMPMVVKALRTKDLTSYSVPSLLLSNVGNLVHSFYVYSLPAGPIWALHGFYLVTTALMLVMTLRYRTDRPQVHGLPHAHGDGTHHSPDVAVRGRYLASTEAGHWGTAEPEDDDDHHHADHQRHHPGGAAPGRRTGPGRGGRRGLHRAHARRPR